MRSEPHVWSSLSDIFVLCFGDSPGRSSRESGGARDPWQSAMAEPVRWGKFGNRFGRGPGDQDLHGVLSPASESLVCTERRLGLEVCAVFFGSGRSFPCFDSLAWV